VSDPIFSPMKLSSTILLLCLLPLSRLQAFTLTSVHSFAVAPQGAQPRAPLVLASGGWLYSTAESGGTNGGGGTVFAINTNGTFKPLYCLGTGNQLMAGLAADAAGNFYGVSASGGQYGQGSVFRITTNGAFSSLYNFGAVTNADGVALDGSNPEGDLVRGKDGRFYGTTYGGGAYDYGTVFCVTTNGTLTNLYSFGTLTDGDGDPLDGAGPVAGLVQGADGAFYGTTSYGGSTDPDYGDNGTVFRITTNATLNLLYSFTEGDGAVPDAGLVQGADGTLYGTTTQGGTSLDGTVFKITTNGALATLYSFTGGNDGSDPEARLLLGNDGNLYGTTAAGGASGDGTLFKLPATGGSVSTLVQFDGANGATPMAGLMQTSDGSLYGTTQDGGTNDAGVVFRVSPAGAASVLFAFPQSNDGANPSADLLSARDGNLYGTTEAGGLYDCGTIFRVSPAGNLTLLYTFGSLTNAEGDPLDGDDAEGILIQGLDGSLYGTTADGGAEYDGTIFQITTNGAFKVLYSFSDSDGSIPLAGLIQTPDGLMYGTTSSGGANEDGTVFQISTNGSLATLYSFGAITDSDGDPLDGAAPDAGLVLGPGGFLYGTTSSGGSANSEGTVFKITTNGALTTVYSFSGGADGGDPEAGLIVGKDGALYGTTYGGGASGEGTVFRITTNGSLNTLVNFAGTNGAYPMAGVVQTADGSLYGTASGGGIDNYGVVFQVATNGVLSWLDLDGVTGSYPESGLVVGSDGNLYVPAEYGGDGGDGNILRVNIVAAPAFQRIVKTAAGISLAWSTFANCSYQVQFKTNLAQANWNNLGSPLAATNTALQISNSPATDPRRFYRVVLLP